MSLQPSDQREEMAKAVYAVSFWEELSLLGDRILDRDPRQHVFTPRWFNQYAADLLNGASITIMQDRKPWNRKSNGA